MTPPSAEVLVAFGLSGSLEHLAGGQGNCYRVGQTILKPTDSEPEAQWIAETVVALLSRSPKAYRLSTPCSTTEGPAVFVYEGWTASSFVAGTEIGSPGPRQLQQFREAFCAARAFHADILAHLGTSKMPAMLSRPQNRWDKADMVAWGEKRLEDVPGYNKDFLVKYFGDTVDRLEAAGARTNPPSTDLACQLVHCDLTNNVLLADGEPPAIIDLTFYWRPVQFAEAIVVADGWAWSGAGLELLDVYGNDHLHLQLILKALYWRSITFGIDADPVWLAENLPRSNYRRAAAMILDLLKASA